MNADTTDLETTSSGARRSFEGDLTSFAYESIRASIVNLTFQPGEPLREASLAKLLEVSRTPIRSALRRLQGEGYVASVPPKGFVVAQISLEDVEHAYRVLEVLEGLASRLAAEQIASDNVAALKKLTNRFEDAARAGDLELWMETDQAFHDTIRAIANNAKLSQSCSLVYSTVDRVRHMHMREQRDAERLAEETRIHGSIAEAVIARDGERAEALTRRVFEDARVANVQLLRRWILPLRRSF
jgi:DNA-binding GntR family transcriptional regulator